MSQSLSPIPTFAHAIRLLFRHWIVLVSLPFIVIISVLLIYFLFAASDYFFAIFTVSFLVAAYTLLVSYLLAQRPDVRDQESLDAFVKRAVNMIVFALLFSFLNAVLTVWGDLFFFAAVLSPVISVATWYLSVRLMVRPSVIAVEDYSLVGSIKRAWSLTGSNHWGTIIICLSAGVACYIGIMAIVLVPIAILAPMSRGEEPWGLLLVFIFGMIAGSILCLPFAIAVQAAVYLRLTSGEDPSFATMESSASVG